MRLSIKEINLLIGAIDTLKCELGEQDYQNSVAHNAEELKDLDKLSNKLVSELQKLESK